MDRTVVLEAVKHLPPPSAVGRPDGMHDLGFDLMTTFHHGYVEVHDRAPAQGTNPFFDEYRDLLVPESAQLRWAQPIGRGDHKGFESHKLGRIFARAYLSMHGYDWFPDVKRLQSAPERGWSARRPAKGDMPDWLVGGSGGLAVAEAKGTHAAIHGRSTVLAEKWRPQLANVEILKNGVVWPVAKSWIIATRWVTEAQPKVEPKMYAEDPDVPDGARPDGDDVPSLVTWLARVHTVRSLVRVGQYRLAQRVTATGAARETVPRVSVTSWQCNSPGIAHLRFVGRPLADMPPPNVWALLAEWPEAFFGRRSRVVHDRWSALWDAWSENALESTWFDGVAVPVLKSLVLDQPPESVGSDAVGPGVSLLRDGSLLAPMSLMEPAGRAEI